MAYTAMCQAHSKSASSICFTHGKFLCIKCLLEKVEEKEDCIKYDMTDIANEKDHTKLKFFTMQQHALKQQETLIFRIKDVNKEREYLVKQVEEAQETLIKNIKDKVDNILTAINNEGNKIESKYQVLVKEIDDQLKPVEADIKRMESEDSDIANIRRSIENLEKELKHKYKVCGTVSADFETDKRITETFKGINSLGTFVLIESEEYEPIGGNDNEAFEKDDIETKQVSKPEKTKGIVTKETLPGSGSAMYEYDILTSNAQPAKQSDNLEKEGDITKIENKEEEKPPPPVPRRSQLQSDDKTADKSKCCCN